MITRYFNLNLTAGRNIPLVINVNQFDHGEQWLFTLYDSNNQKYTPSSGAIVGIKSDGLGIVNSGSVDSEGRVVINETEQMTAAVGKAVYELMIDNQTHGTANFIVLVEAKPGNNADLSESDLSLLQKAIDSTNPAAIAEGVSDWMDENLTPTTPVVDASLTVSGAAADSKATGDALNAKVEMNPVTGLDHYWRLKTNDPSQVTIIPDKGEIDDLKSQITTEENRAKAEEQRLEELFTTPTQEAVDNWLNEHPEATTTVQDASLTYKKLVNGTLNFVTPEMYGAKGDGLTDDSTAITNALASGFMVVFGEKTYSVNSTITIPSDSVLCFSNTTIKNNGDDVCIKIQNAENATFIGSLNIVGNNTHTSEYKHGLSILTCSNVYVERVISKYNNGDGVYIGQTTGINNNIVIGYCEASYNSRNGLSVIGGIGVEIGYLTGEGNVYNAPMALFDIEPNNANDNVVAHIGSVVDKNTRPSSISNRFDTTAYNVRIDSYFSDTTFLNFNMNNTLKNCETHVGKIHCVASTYIRANTSGLLTIGDFYIKSSTTDQLFGFTANNLNMIIENLVILESSAISLTGNTAGTIIINNVTDKAGIPCRNITNMKVTVNNINNFTMKEVSESLTTGVHIFDNLYRLVGDCAELRLNSFQIPNGMKYVVKNETDHSVSINGVNTNTVLRPDGTVGSNYMLESGKTAILTTTIGYDFCLLSVEAVY